MKWVLAATESDSSGIETINELTKLSLSDWLVAGGLIVGSVVLAMGARRLVERLLRDAASPFVARLLGRLVAFVLFAIGFIYALNQVGVSIAPLLGILGIAGLALAFAFQDILENFIAGIIMSIRKPFGSGDQITTVGYSGVVEEINLRAIELRTFDGERVFIPNATVWKDPIVNHTLLGVRRTRIDVGVDYTADLDEATRVILEAVRAVDGVVEDPAPEAFVFAFGASSIDIAVRFWHQPQIANEWRVRDSVAKRVKAALDAAGIGIPFPQRVLHFATELTTHQD